MTDRRAGPPRFRRLPRRHVAAPDVEAEIKSPPAAPSKPNVDLITILLPLVGSLVVGALIAIIAERPSFMLFSVPMLMVSGASSLYNHQRAQKRYRETTAEREVDYRGYLAARRLELTDLRDRQRTASLVPHPSIDECRRRAEARDEKLWERLPGHTDFLMLRLGRGRVSATYAMKTPSPTVGSLKIDSLLQDARALGDEFRHVDGCAVSLPLPDVGTAGVIGDTRLATDAMRALVMQIATHHSPAEVKIVVCCSAEAADDWAWARWLPHTWSVDRRQRYLAASPDAAAALLLELGDELRRRALTKREDTAAPSDGPAFVCVFADPTLWEGPHAGRVTPTLQLLRHSAREIRAYSLFLHDYGERAGAVIDLTGGASRLEIIGPPRREFVYEVDTVGVAEADAFARMLAPLRPPATDSAEIPNSVGLLELLGAERVEDLAVEERWAHSAPYESLAVPIGLRAGREPLYLDIHERGHGPHGLAAGATGSGKSELLQTLIASLAVHFDPWEVSFVLIDYKGGGMSSVFRDLPHQIGIITNLGGNLTSRALAAFRAENRRRQMIFDRVGVTSLDAYQRRVRNKEPLEPLSHVVIIADEFAELKQHRPEFMSELVSLVRIGRSLGMHLLLATQKPGGVVTDQIVSNTRYRLCLRVAQPEDSMEMLRVPDAAGLRLPGRGFCQVGLNEVFELFQSGFAGAAYEPTGGADLTRHDIDAVALDGSRRKLFSGAGPVGRKGVRQTAIEAVVAQVREVADRVATARGLPPLRKFWLNPLPETLPLDAVRSAQEGWDGQQWNGAAAVVAPAFGLADDPSNQAQFPLRMPLDREGHSVIYGLPGSGKTVLLQTVIASLVSDHPPDMLHLYLLDFGGRTLKLFEGLPHVAAVILPDEGERLARMFQSLLRELEQRKQLFAGSGNHESYRTAHPGAPPAIVIVIDNFSEFSAAYPPHLDDVGRLSREGGSLGLHLVITASTLNAVPNRILSTITNIVTLELKDPMDYRSVVGRTLVLPDAGIRGRGLVKAVPPLEFQTALPVPGANDYDRTLALTEMTARMRAAWTGPVAPSIATLPTAIPASSLMAASASRPFAVALGLEYETLARSVVSLADGPHFLITGPPESGKTSLLHTWVLALAAAHPPDALELHFVGLGAPGLRQFATLPHAAGYIDDDDRFGEMVEKWRVIVAERRATLARNTESSAPQDAPLPAIVVAIDDLSALRASTKDAHRAALDALIRRSRGLGFHVLATAVASDIQIATDIAKALKDAQVGFVLGSNDPSELNVLNLRPPLGHAGRPLPAGRGYFGRRGRGRLVQTASCYVGGDDPQAWIERIRRSAAMNSPRDSGASE